MRISPPAGKSQPLSALISRWRTRAKAICPDPLVRQLWANAIAETLAFAAIVSFILATWLILGGMHDPASLHLQVRP